MSDFSTNKESGIEPKGIRAHFEAGVGKILDIAAKTQDKLTDKGPLYKWLYQYVLINIIWAKPSLSLVCSTERVEQLRQLGLTETGIFSLVLTQFAVDHVAPNIIIGGIHTLANSTFDMSEKVMIPASFIAGRIAWGVLAGLVHASAFALTKSSQNLDEARGFISVDSIQSPVLSNINQEIDIKYSHSSF